VIIHQVYELWFKQILHEAALLQARLEAGHSTGALHPARRIAKILKTIVGQLDVLETMTPQQFASFRPQLGSSSGFQSAHFQRDRGGARAGATSPRTTPGTAAALTRRSVFDSRLHYLAGSGYDVPEPALEREPSRAMARRRPGTSSACSGSSTPMRRTRRPRSARRWSTSMKASRSGGTGT